MVSVGEVEPAAVVGTLRQALDAIGRLSAERAGVEEALKVEKNKDNILPRIMAAGGQHDKLFAEELKKYEPLKVRGPSLPSMNGGRCCHKPHNVKAYASMTSAVLPGAHVAAFCTMHTWSQVGTIHDACKQG